MGTALHALPDAPRRSGPPADPDADREFWVSFRRALLAMVDAIEQHQHIPSVIEQYERRQAAKKS